MATQNIIATQSIQELFDREAIKEVRARFAQALDFKDWTLFESLFLEELETDYADFGIPAQKMRREDLSKIFKYAFGREGLRTQHIISNFRITVTGDTAQCISHFLGQHYIQGFEGGEEFDLKAQYTDQLVRTEDGWKIRAVKFTVFYTLGNRALIEP